MPPPRRAAPPRPLPPPDVLVEMDDDTLWRQCVEPRLHTDELTWLGPFASLELAPRIHAMVSFREKDITDQMAITNAAVESGEETRTPEEVASWRRRAVATQRALRRRKQQLDQPAKRGRQAAHAGGRGQSDSLARQTLRQLATAVFEHEQAVDAGASANAADGQLWQLLDVLTVPYHGEDHTLRYMIREGPWQPRDDDPQS